MAAQPRIPSTFFMKPNFLILSRLLDANRAARTGHQLLIITSALAVGVACSELWGDAAHSFAGTSGITRNITVV